jgi:hypothetical protein
MANRLQHLRGSETEHSTFTGEKGEISLVTDTSANRIPTGEVRVHDGTTAGGLHVTGAARAWVNFNGTLAMTVGSSYGPDAPPADYSSPNPIRASYNVASITDNGTGDYTVNFATAMPDANYAVNCTREQGQDASYAFICYPRYPTSTYTTSSSFRFASTVTNSGALNGAYQDSAFLTVSIFR